MSQKHLLTAFHCVVAAIVTPTGLAGAGAIADDRPVAALAVAFLAIIFPVLIATRVAWVSGYAAGREEAEAAAELTSAPQSPSAGPGNPDESSGFNP